ncbi:hypothetical protein NDA15_001334 [Ustilago hordei]|nr:hypothetical protein NDA15_001334 [Ustilago hordei]
MLLELGPLCGCACSLSLVLFVAVPGPPRIWAQSSFAFSFNLDEQEDINYEKYASPTGPRYVKSRVDPYNKSRTDHYALDQEEDSSIMAELNRSKPIATPFPKFNPQDMEIFILEAEAWFKFNQVYEQTRMINHMADPFEEATDSGDGHTGSTEMGDPKAMDLSSYQQPMDPDHEEEHNDDDDKGNISGILADTGAGLSIVSDSFISADKGVEMEVEVDKVVTAADIPKPYQHLRDVFNEVEADKLPHHTEHDLHLELIEGGKPPQGPLYLKGPKEMSELRRYLDENLEKGFIRPSKSPARSPVLFVPKKDGGLRLCVDYRGLNEITVKNRAPLPLIEEQLFLLRKARIYTKLDLRAAYNLIWIAKGDEWKTAFGTQLGLYEYLVMPFGLANALAHFQSFINDIFQDIIGIYVVVYLDDFLIFSDTEEAHVKHVTKVLTHLRSNRLFAKLLKCEFHTKTVKFLGYIIKPTGIEMDPEKVCTVKEWPMPESIHDIQRFLGFANFYRRFIAHFARIAKPLTSLVKPTEWFKEFELPEEAQQAFHKLIQAFTSAGVLQHFNYHLPTRLETDASDFAIAGVLKQEHEGQWHPVAFYSRKMSPAEKNYEIHDKELLAVVACLTQWRHMLAGLPRQLVILTDHEALKYFKSQRCITGRQA